MRMKVLLVLAVILAACGSGSGSATTATTGQPTSSPATTATTTTSTTTTVPLAAGFPVTIVHGAGDVTLPDRPEAIISLSPASTEILFAIGAGEQVIAVDDQSNYPPEAPPGELSGFTPNVEAIAALEPDLVVIGFDPGDVQVGLTRLGIPVIVHFAAVTLDDAYTQIAQLGAATGHAAEADALVASIEEDLASIQADLPDGTDGLTYYHELDSTYFTVTSSTFVGQLYGLLGLENIADAHDIDGFGYPQLSQEHILAADPDFVFLADTKCCGESAETVAARAGWDNLSAVASGAVVELDDDIASRWGPRIVDFVRAVAEAIADHPVTSSG